MPKRIAAVNITGPNGEILVAADPDNNEIPDDWPEEFVTSLLETGGAVEVEDADTVADIVPEEEA